MLTTGRERFKCSPPAAATAARPWAVRKPARSSGALPAASGTAAPPGHLRPNRLDSQLAGHRATPRRRLEGTRRTAPALLDQPLGALPGHQPPCPVVDQPSPGGGRSSAPPPGHSKRSAMSPGSSSSRRPNRHRARSGPARAGCAPGGHQLPCPDEGCGSHRVQPRAPPCCRGARRPAPRPSPGHQPVLRLSPTSAVVGWRRRSGRALAAVVPPPRGSARRRSARPLCSGRRATFPPSSRISFRSGCAAHRRARARRVGGRPRPSARGAAARSPGGPASRRPARLTSERASSSPAVVEPAGGARVRAAPRLGPAGRPPLGRGTRCLRLPVTATLPEHQGRGASRPPWVPPKRSTPKAGGRAAGGHAAEAPVADPPLSERRPAAASRSTRGQRSPSSHQGARGEAAENRRTANPKGR